MDLTTIDTTICPHTLKYIFFHYSFLRMDPFQVQHFFKIGRRLKLGSGPLSVQGIHLVISFSVGLILEGIILNLWNMPINGKRLSILASVG